MITRTCRYHWLRLTRKMFYENSLEAISKNIPPLPVPKMWASQAQQPFTTTTPQTKQVERKRGQIIIILTFFIWNRQSTVQVIRQDQVKSYRWRYSPPSQQPFHQQLPTPLQPGMPYPATCPAGSNQATSTVIKKGYSRHKKSLSPLEEYIETLSPVRLPEKYTVIMTTSHKQIDDELKLMVR
ncbi:hypothetical protein BC941DRAFT_231352 [Chlamydoabsidia padenii]|nr:hypothetical protein BC941DRAFT_231352 [Chlamydoabsidia padenii]